MTDVYDVIVVGAGCGGLTAAAYLAAAGRRVVVVDRRPEPGGHAGAFTRDGYEFDVGLHYLGSDTHGRPATARLLAPLGIEHEYVPIDPVDVVLLPDGSRFEVPTGLERFRANLHAALPGERAAVDRYLDTVVALDDEISRMSRIRSLGDVPGTVRQAGPLIRHLRSTLGGVWDGLGLSLRARALVGWISGVYAVTPSEASMLMHAMMTMHYVRGAWYPRGGGGVLAQSLAESFTGHGGEFMLGHEVTRIVIKDGRVTGVQARGGDGTTVALTAPVVVAAGDIKRTYLELLDPAVVPVKVRRRVRGYEMALPLAVVYLVVARDLAAEGVAPNTAIIGDEDLQAGYAALQRGELPAQPVWVWMTSASRKDPQNARLCPPGHTNLQLMTLVPPHPRSWGLEVGEARGEAYARAKGLVQEGMLRAAERAVPGLLDCVVHVDLATPYTEQRYMGVTDGTSYGIAATPDQLVLGRPAHKTSLRGLYLAGASARSGHGITGTMSGGIETASAVLGRSAFHAVRAGRTSR